MTEVEAIKFVESHKWTFAKTMAEIPHEWLFIKSCKRQDFFDFLQYIRENGYPQKFFSKTFTYMNVGEYKYWTM